MRGIGVSVVYQHPALAPDLTVLENLQLAAPVLDARAADALIARVATPQLRMPVNRRVAELSLAQRHIVELARAIASNPKVLFLDEPTEPLQQADVRKLFELIAELKRDGVAIVYVSHRLHEVDELADRISVMRDGEIIDRRLARAITASEIVTLIAGKPLGQIFPPKAASWGEILFETRGLSGTRFRPCRHGGASRRNRRPRRNRGRRPARVHSGRCRHRSAPLGRGRFWTAVRSAATVPARSAGPASGSSPTIGTKKASSSI